MRSIGFVLGVVAKIVDSICELAIFMCAKECVRQGSGRKKSLTPITHALKTRPLQPAVVALQERVVQLLRASTVLRISTLSRNISLRGPGFKTGIMPPKQATLGYVKTQLTLGSVASTL